MAVTAPYPARHGSHWIADRTDPPRQMSGVGWGAMVSLGIVSLLEVVRIFSTLNLHSAASEEGDITSAYHSYSIWVGLAALASLISAAVFIAWFYRSYRNLGRLGVQNMRYGPGWAIGAWFVPILNLFRPKQIANDLWRGSENGVEITTQWRQEPVPSLVHWWWGLFVSQGVLLEIGQQTSASGYSRLTGIGSGSLENGLSQIKTGTMIDLLGAVLSIAAAVTAIALVSRVSKRLDAVRDEALGAAAATQPMAPPGLGAPPPARQAAAAPLPGGSAAPPEPVGPLPSLAGEQRIQCPECAEWVQPLARICRFCGHQLGPTG